jgi:hypothetical protein
MFDHYAREMDRRAQIATMPRVRFVCERDWCRGPFDYRIGLMWAKDEWAEAGVFAYHRWFFIVLKFRLWLDRN